MKTLLISIGIFFSCQISFAQGFSAHVWFNAGDAHRIKFPERVPGIADSNHLSFLFRKNDHYFLNLGAAYNFDNESFVEIGGWTQKSTGGYFDFTNPGLGTLAEVKNNWTEIRVDFFRKFTPLQSPKYNTFWGFGMNSFWHKTILTPLPGSSIYAGENSVNGVTFSITPRLHYFFTDKFFLNSGINIELIKIWKEEGIILNPNFSKGQQEHGILNFYFVPVFQLKIGLAYKFYE